LAALAEHRRRQAVERLLAGSSWHAGDFVFATRRGEPLHANNVRRAFKDHVRRAGLPPQRFHDLRHACATLLLEQGEELGVVSKVLGHSTISTTLDTYGHLTDGMSQRVADRMDAILGRSTRGVG
jgi:integrase